VLHDEAVGNVKTSNKVDQECEKSSCNDLLNNKNAFIKKASSKKLKQPRKKHLKYSKISSVACF
jgi:hypothetical protein